MASEDNKKPSVSPLQFPPGPADIAVFQAIHTFADRIVLVPVVVNGQERFALALLCQGESGDRYLQILAYLARPTDVVLSTNAGQSYNQGLPNKKDLN